MKMLIRKSDIDGALPWVVYGPRDGQHTYFETWEAAIQSVPYLLEQFRWVRTHG